MQDISGHTSPAVDMDFTMSNQLVMDAKRLKGYIDAHRRLKAHYNRLHDAYIGNYSILKAKRKDAYKPDNRLVCNFAKYITDTFNGFFIGRPIKTTCDRVKVADYIQEISRANNIDDLNAELSKLCSIYGHAFELLYVDEDSKPSMVALTPLEAFIVYDTSIRKSPRYGVRYYVNDEGVIEGSFSDNERVFYFVEQGTSYKLIDEVPHYFEGVPLIEYVENTEKQGIFEGVLSLIDGYNKAVSEKANDVEYYADSYLKILGADLDEDTIKNLRSSRIINLPGTYGENIEVDFLAKPEVDTTQENLIARLERLIYQLSMVANINAESFGNASGISLQYKLQPMINLATVKERKFTKALNDRWRLISSLPISRMSEQDCGLIEYTFTQNLPANALEEAQIAGMLSGIVSEETQLRLLTVVGDVKAELRRKDEEARGYDYELLEQKARDLSQPAEPERPKS